MEDLLHFSRKREYVRKFNLTFVHNEDLNITHKLCEEYLKNLKNLSDISILNSMSHSIGIPSSDFIGFANKTSTIKLFSDFIVGNNSRKNLEGDFLKVNIRKKLSKEIKNNSVIFSDSNSTFIDIVSSSLKTKKETVTKIMSDFTDFDVNVIKKMKRLKMKPLMSEMNLNFKPMNDISFLWNDLAEFGKKVSFSISKPLSVLVKEANLTDAETIVNKTFSNIMSLVVGVNESFLDDWYSNTINAKRRMKEKTIDNNLQALRFDKSQWKFFSPHLFSDDLIFEKVETAPKHVREENVKSHFIENMDWLIKNIPLKEFNDIMNDDDIPLLQSLQKTSPVTKKDLSKILDKETMQLFSSVSLNQLTNHSINSDVPLLKSIKEWDFKLRNSPYVHKPMFDWISMENLNLDAYAQNLSLDIHSIYRSLNFSKPLIGFLNNSTFDELKNCYDVDKDETLFSTLMKIKYLDSNVNFIKTKSLKEAYKNFDLPIPKALDAHIHRLCKKLPKLIHDYVNNNRTVDLLAKEVNLDKQNFSNIVTELGIDKEYKALAGGFMIGNDFNDFSMKKEKQKISNKINQFLNAFNLKDFKFSNDEFSFYQVMSKKQPNIPSDALQALFENGKALNFGQTTLNYLKGSVKNAILDLNPGNDPLLEQKLKSLNIASLISLIEEKAKDVKSKLSTPMLLYRSMFKNDFFSNNIDKIISKIGETGGSFIKNVFNMSDDEFSSVSSISIDTLVSEKFSRRNLLLLPGNDLVEFQKMNDDEKERALISSIQKLKANATVDNISDIEVVSKKDTILMTLAKTLDIDESQMFKLYSDFFTRSQFDMLMKETYMNLVSRYGNKPLQDLEEMYIRSQPKKGVNTSSINEKSQIIFEPISHRTRTLSQSNILVMKMKRIVSKLYYLDDEYIVNHYNITKEMLEFFMEAPFIDMKNCYNINTKPSLHDILSKIVKIQYNPTTLGKKKFLSLKKKFNPIKNEVAKLKWKSAAEFCKKYLKVTEKAAILMKNTMAKSFGLPKSDVDRFLNRIGISDLFNNYNFHSLLNNDVMMDQIKKKLTKSIRAAFDKIPLKKELYDEKLLSVLSKSSKSSDLIVRKLLSDYTNFNPNVVNLMGKSKITDLLSPSSKDSKKTKKLGELLDDMLNMGNRLTDVMNRPLVSFVYNSLDGTLQGTLLELISSTTDIKRNVLEKIFSNKERIGRISTVDNLKSITSLSRKQWPLIMPNIFSNEEIYTSVTSGPKLKQEDALQNERKKGLIWLINNLSLKNYSDVFKNNKQPVIKAISNTFDISHEEIKDVLDKEPLLLLNSVSVRRFSDNSNNDDTLAEILDKLKYNLRDSPYIHTTILKSNERSKTIEYLMESNSIDTDAVFKKLRMQNDVTQFLRNTTVDDVKDCYNIEEDDTIFTFLLKVDYLDKDKEYWKIRNIKQAYRKINKPVPSVLNFPIHKFCEQLPELISNYTNSKETEKKLAQDLNIEPKKFSSLVSTLGIKKQYANLAGNVMLGNDYPMVQAKKKLNKKISDFLTGFNLGDFKTSNDEYSFYDLVQKNQPKIGSDALQSLFEKEKTIDMSNTTLQYLSGKFTNILRDLNPGNDPLFENTISKSSMASLVNMIEKKDKYLKKQSSLPLALSLPKLGNDFYSMDIASVASKVGNTGKNFLKTAFKLGNDEFSSFSSKSVNSLISGTITKKNILFLSSKNLISLNSLSDDEKQSVLLDSIKKFKSKSNLFVANKISLIMKSDNLVATHIKLFDIDESLMFKLYEKTFTIKQFDVFKKGRYIEISEKFGKNLTISELERLHWRQVTNKDDRSTSKTQKSAKSPLVKQPISLRTMGRKVSLILPMLLKEIASVYYYIDSDYVSDYYNLDKRNLETLMDTQLIDIISCYSVNMDMSLHQILTQVIKYQNQMKKTIREKLFSLKEIDEVLVTKELKNEKWKSKRKFCKNFLELTSSDSIRIFDTIAKSIGLPKSDFYDLMKKMKTKKNFKDIFTGLLRNNELSMNDEKKKLRKKIFKLLHTTPIDKKLLKSNLLNAISSKVGLDTLKSLKLLSDFTDLSENTLQLFKNVQIKTFDTNMKSDTMEKVLNDVITKSRTITKSINTPLAVLGVRENWKTSKLINKNIESVIRKSSNTSESLLQNFFTDTKVVERIKKRSVYSTLQHVSGFSKKQLSLIKPIAITDRKLFDDISTGPTEKQKEAVRQQILDGARWLVHNATIREIELLIKDNDKTLPLTESLQSVTDIAKGDLEEVLGKEAYAIYSSVSLTQISSHRNMKLSIIEVINKWKFALRDVLGMHMQMNDMDDNIKFSTYAEKRNIDLLAVFKIIEFNDDVINHFTNFTVDNIKICYDVGDADTFFASIIKIHYLDQNKDNRKIENIIQAYRKNKLIIPKNLQYSVHKFCKQLPDLISNYTNSKETEKKLAQDLNIEPKKFSSLVSTLGIKKQYANLAGNVMLGNDYPMVQAKKKLNKKINNFLTGFNLGDFKTSNDEYSFYDLVQKNQPKIGSDALQSLFEKEKTIDMSNTTLQYLSGKFTDILRDLNPGNDPLFENTISKSNMASLVNMIEKKDKYLKKQSSLPLALSLPKLGNDFYSMDIASVASKVGNTGMNFLKTAFKLGNDEFSSFGSKSVNSLISGTITKKNLLMLSAKTMLSLHGKNESSRTEALLEGIRQFKSKSSVAVASKRAVILSSDTIVESHKKLFDINEETMMLLYKDKYTKKQFDLFKVEKYDSLKDIYGEEKTLLQLENLAFKKILNAERCGKVCKVEWSPVCGSDGRTYFSDCSLKKTSCLEESKTEHNKDGICDESLQPYIDKTFSQLVKNEHMRAAFQVNLFVLAEEYFNTGVESLQKAFLLTANDVESLKKISFKQFTSCFDIALNDTLANAFHKVKTIDFNEEYRAEKLKPFKNIEKTLQKKFSEPYKKSIVDFCLDYHKKITKVELQTKVVDSFSKKIIPFSSRENLNAINTFLGSNDDVSEFAMSTFTGAASSDDYLSRIATKIEAPLKKIPYSNKIDSLTIPQVLASKARVGNDAMNSYYNFFVNLEPLQKNLISSFNIGAFKPLIGSDHVVLSDINTKIKETTSKMIEIYTKIPIRVVFQKENIAGDNEIFNSSMVDMFNRKTQLTKEVILKSLGLKSDYHNDAILKLKELFKKRFPSMDSRRLLSMTFQDLFSQQVDDFLAGKLSRKAFANYVNGQVNLGNDYIFKSLTGKLVQAMCKLATNSGVTIIDAMRSCFGMSNDELQMNLGIQRFAFMQTRTLKDILSPNLGGGNVEFSLFDPLTNYFTGLKFFSNIKVSLLPLYCNLSRDYIYNNTLSDVSQQCTRQDLVKLATKSISVIADKALPQIINELSTIHGTKDDFYSFNILELSSLYNQPKSVILTNKLKDVLPPAEQQKVVIAKESLYETLRKSPQISNDEEVDDLLTNWTGENSNVFRRPFNDFIPATSTGVTKKVLDSKIQYLLKFYVSFSNPSLKAFAPIKLSDELGACSTKNKSLTMKELQDKCIGETLNNKYLPKISNDYTLAEVTELTNITDNEEDIDFFQLNSMANFHTNKAHSISQKSFALSGSGILSNHSINKHPALTVVKKILDIESTSILKKIFNLSNDAIARLETLTMNNISSLDNHCLDEKLNLMLSMDALFKLADEKKSKNVLLHDNIQKHYVNLSTLSFGELTAVFDFTQETYGKKDLISFFSDTFGANSLETMLTFGMTKEELSHVQNITISDITKLHVFDRSIANDPSPHKLLEFILKIPNDCLKTMFQRFDSIRSNATTVFDIFKETLPSLQYFYRDYYVPNDEMFYVNSVDMADELSAFNITHMIVQMNASTHEYITDVYQLIGNDIPKFIEYKNWLNTELSDWTGSTGYEMSFNTLFKQMGFQHHLSNDYYFNIPPSYHDYIINLSPSSFIQLFSQNRELVYTKNTIDLVRYVSKTILNIVDNFHNTEMVLALHMENVTINEALSLSVTEYIKKIYGTGNETLFDDLKVLANFSSNDDFVQWIGGKKLNELNTLKYKGKEALGFQTQELFLMIKFGDVMKYFLGMKSLKEIKSTHANSIHKFRKIYSCQKIMRMFDFSSKVASGKPTMFVSKNIFKLPDSHIAKESNLARKEIEYLQRLKLGNLEKFSRFSKTKVDNLSVIETEHMYGKDVKVKLLGSTLPEMTSSYTPDQLSKLTYKQVMANHIGYKVSQLKKLLNKYLKGFVKEYSGFNKAYMDTILGEKKVTTTLKRSVRSIQARSFYEGEVPLLSDEKSFADGTSSSDSGTLMSFLVDMGKNINGCNNDSTKCAESKYCVLTKFGFTCTKCQEDEIFNRMLAICENECSSQYILSNPKCNEESKSLVEVKNFQTKIEYNDKFIDKRSKEFLGFASQFEVHLLESVKNDESIVGVDINNLTREGNVTNVDFTFLVNTTDEKTRKSSGAIAVTLSNDDVKEALSPIQSNDNSNVDLKDTDVCEAGKHDCDASSRCVTLSAFKYRCESCNSTCISGSHIFCGTDGRSYLSDCDMYKRECVDNIVIRKKYDGICIDQVPAMSRGTFDSNIRHDLLLPATKMIFVEIATIFFNTDKNVLENNYLFSNSTIANISRVSLRQASSLYSIDLHTSLHEALVNILNIDRNTSVRNNLYNKHLKVLRSINHTYVNSFIGDTDNMDVYRYVTLFDKLSESMYDSMLINHFIRNQLNNTTRKDYDTFNSFFDVENLMKKFILGTIRNDMSARPYMKEIETKLKKVLNKIKYKPNMDDSTILSVISDQIKINQNSTVILLRTFFNFSIAEENIVSSKPLKVLKVWLNLPATPSLNDLLNELKERKHSIDKNMNETPIIVVASQANVTQLSEIKKITFLNMISRAMGLSKDQVLAMVDTLSKQVDILLTPMGNIFSRNFNGVSPMRLLHMTWKVLITSNTSSSSNIIDGHVMKGYRNMFQNKMVKDLPFVYDMSDTDVKQMTFRNILNKYALLRNDELQEIFSKASQLNMDKMSFNSMLGEAYLFGNIKTNMFVPNKYYTQGFYWFIRARLSVIPHYCNIKQQSMDFIPLETLTQSCTNQDIRAFGEDIATFIHENNHTLKSIKHLLNKKFSINADDMNIMELLTLAYDGRSSLFLRTFKDLLPGQSGFLVVAERSIIDILVKSSNHITSGQMKRLLTLWNGGLPISYSNPIKNLGKKVDRYWSVLYNSQIRFFFKYLNAIGDGDSVLFNDLRFLSMFGMCNANVNDTLGYIRKNCTRNNAIEIFNTDKLTPVDVSDMRKTASVTQLDLFSIMVLAKKSLSNLRVESAKPMVVIANTDISKHKDDVLSDVIMNSFNISQNTFKVLFNLSSDDINTLNTTFTKILERSKFIRDMKVMRALSPDTIINEVLSRTSENVSVHAKIIESQRMVLMKPFEQLEKYFNVTNLNNVNTMTSLKFNEKFMGANEAASMLILMPGDHAQNVFENFTFGAMAKFLPINGTESNLEPISPFDLLQFATEIPGELHTLLVRRFDSLLTTNSRNMTIADIIPSKRQLDSLKSYMQDYLPTHQTYLDGIEYLQALENVTLNRLLHNEPLTSLANKSLAQVIGFNLSNYVNFEGFLTTPYGDWLDLHKNKSLKSLAISMGFPNAIDSGRIVTVPTPYKDFINANNPRSGLQKLSMRNDGLDSKTLKEIIDLLVSGAQNITKSLDREIVDSLKNIGINSSEALPWTMTHYIKQAHGIHPKVLLDDIKYLDKPTANTSEIIDEFNKLKLKDLKAFSFKGTKKLNETTETGQLLFKFKDFITHHFQQQSFDQVMKNRLKSAKSFRNLNLNQLMNIFDLKNNDLDENSPFFVSSKVLGLNRTHIMEAANITDQDYTLLSKMKLKDFKNTFTPANNDFYSITLNDIEKLADSPHTKVIGSSLDDIEKFIGSERFKKMGVLEALSVHKNVSKLDVDKMLNEFLTSNDEEYGRGFKKYFMKANLRKYSIDNLKNMKKIATENQSIATVRDLIVGLNKNMHECKLKSDTCTNDATCVMTSLGRSCHVCGDNELLNEDRTKCEYKCGPKDYKKTDACQNKDMKMIYADSFNTELKYDEDLENKESLPFKDFASAFEVFMQDALQRDNVTKGIFVNNLREQLGNKSNTTYNPKTSTPENTTIVDFYVMLELPQNYTSKTPVEILQESLDDALNLGLVPFASPLAQSFTLQEHSLCKSGSVQCGKHADCVQLSSFNYRCECRSGYELKDGYCSEVNDKNVALYIGVAAVVIASITLAIVGATAFVKWKRTKFFIPFTSMDTGADGF